MPCSEIEELFGQNIEDTMFLILKFKSKVRNLKFKIKFKKFNSL